MSDSDRPDARETSPRSNGRGLVGLAGVDRLDSQAVWRAFGGVQGLIEAITPGLLFVIVFTATRDLWWAAGASAGIVVVLAIWRAIRGGGLAQVANGIIGVLISAGLALLTGRASANYLPGLLANAGTIALLGISLLVRRPLLAVAVAVLRGQPELTKSNKLLRRAGAWATLVWLAISAVRLVVQVPLFLQAAHTDDIVALGTVKIAMGLPLLALGAVATWLILHPVMVELDAEDAETQDATGADASAESVEGEAERGAEAEAVNPAQTDEAQAQDRVNTYRPPIDG